MASSGVLPGYDLSRPQRGQAAESLGSGSPQPGQSGVSAVLQCGQRLKLSGTSLLQRGQVTFALTSTGVPGSDGATGSLCLSGTGVFLRRPQRR